MKLERRVIKFVSGCMLLPIATFLAGCNISKKLNQPSAESMYHYMIGEMHKHQGNFSEAFENYDKAIKLDPNSAHLHNSIGKLLSENKDLFNATLHFMEATKLDNESSEIRTNLIDTYIRTGELDKASEETKELEKLDPTTALGYFGEIMYIRGDFGSARWYFKTAIQLESAKSDWIVAYYRLGAMDYKKENYSEAIENFEKAVESYSPTEDYHLYLKYKSIVGIAISYYASGDSQKAREELNHMYKDLKKEPELVNEFILRLGEVKFLEKALEERR